MTLEAAAQLLATALLLLQSVSANPALPQSVRDQAQQTAEKAITEATRTLGVPRATGGEPTCTIKSDKYNYWLGEIIVFRWTSANVSSARVVPSSSGIDTLPVRDMELAPGGEWRTKATTSGYPFATIEVKDASGRRAACSAMVNVH